MSKVDFYILPTDSLSARLDFACKLCEKAWRLGHRVYLHCQDAEQRDELDLRLWRFKGEAFVPPTWPRCMPTPAWPWAWRNTPVTITTC